MGNSIQQKNEKTETNDFTRISALSFFIPNLGLGRKLPVWRDILEAAIYRAVLIEVCTALSAAAASCVHKTSLVRKTAGLGFTTLERLAVLNNQLLQTFQLAPQHKRAKSLANKIRKTVSAPNTIHTVPNPILPSLSVELHLQTPCSGIVVFPPRKKNIGEITLSPHLPVSFLGAF